MPLLLIGPNTTILFVNKSIQPEIGFDGEHNFFFKKKPNPRHAVLRSIHQNCVAQLQLYFIRLKYEIKAENLPCSGVTVAQLLRTPTNGQITVYIKSGAYDSNIFIDIFKIQLVRFVTVGRQFRAD